MRILIENKFFGQKQVLGKLRLEIEPGEFLAITGPSGCGKTTLLRLVAGLDKASEMTFSDPPHRIGFVFQEPRLLPWRTVLENLILANGAAADARGRAEQALHSVELWPERDLYPDALSLGMKRRLELARALAVRPELLLLDEPFVSLDKAAATVLRRLLMLVWQEHKPMVLMVSHDFEEGLLLADRFLVLAGEPAVFQKDLALQRPRSERDASWLRQTLSEFEAQRAVATPQG